VIIMDDNYVAGICIFFVALIIILLYFLSGMPASSGCSTETLCSAVCGVYSFNFSNSNMTGNNTFCWCIDKNGKQRKYPLRV
jgi:phosphate/sulfate permease